MKKLTIIFILLLSGSVYPCAPSQGITGHTIRPQIPSLGFRQAPLVPIGGTIVVLVNLDTEDLWFARSDAFGAFSFSDLKCGNYEATGLKKGSEFTPVHFVLGGQQGFSFTIVGRPE